MARVFILFILINVGTILFISRPTQQELMIVGVYYLPVFLVFAVFMATGLREWLIHFLEAFGEKRRPVLLFLVILILVLIPIYQFRQNLPDTNRSGDYYARDYGTTLLTSLPPDTILLVNWDDIFTIWYLQMVEGVRPDVIPVLADLPLGSGSNFWGKWYFDDLKEDHPEIFSGYPLDENMFLTREEALTAFVTSNLARDRDVYLSFYGLGYDFEMFDFYVFPKGPVYEAKLEPYNLVDMIESQQAWERVIANFRNLYSYRERMIPEEDFIIARLSSNLYNTAKVTLGLDREKAEWFLEQAVMVDRGNLPATMDLAMIRFQAGKYTEARDLLLDAREIDPSNPDIHMVLARLYQALGQNELAIQSLEYLLMIDPNHPDARATIEQLRGNQ
jgi:tetratricopeptide (TPR) repeat protein